MRKLSNALNQSPVDDDTNEPQSKRCSASGCPLMGTVSHDTNGHGRYYCYIHYGSPGGGEITNNIMERKALIELAQRASNTRHVEWEVRREKLKPYLEHHGRSDLIPHDDESANHWAVRALQTLKRECVTSIHSPVANWQDDY